MGETNGQYEEKIIKGRKATNRIAIEGKRSIKSIETVESVESVKGITKNIKIIIDLIITRIFIKGFLFRVGSSPKLQRFQP